MILLGFATLMFGMDAMSAAVSGLKDVPGFAELFLLLSPTRYWACWWARC